MQPSRQLLQTTDKSKFNVSQDPFTVQNLSDHLHVTYLTTDSHIVTGGDAGGWRMSHSCV